jgi:hypothetical protein
MFSGDSILDYKYLKENVNKEKYNLLSPIEFSQYKDKNEFTFNIIKNSIMLGNMYNEFATIESIIKKNTTIIYFNLAHQNVKYDEIYIINKNLVETQETYLNYFLAQNNIRFNYIKSNLATKEFKDVKEFLDYINAV